VITYKELAELTGEPLREVSFYLPPWCVPILRRIKGWEDFDPLMEVIHCDKPGTGCFAAPRCFSLKLAKVTGETCGMVSCIVDNELCILHQNGRLLALMAKHFDDLKIAGETEAVKHLKRKIQEIFGDLKLEKNCFKNCGVNHIQDPTTKEIKMDQDEQLQE
jgi:hypothetical protein